MITKRKVSGNLLKDKIFIVNALKEALNVGLEAKFISWKLIRKCLSENISKKDTCIFFPVVIAYLG